MRILILSDSHYRPLDEINFKSYDYVFHLGDYGMSKETLDSNGCLYVAGNCDFLGQKDIIKDINNKRFYLTHGDKYNVKYQYNSLIYKALSLDANICLFGHTHVSLHFERDNITFINPGAYNDGYYVILDDKYITFYRYDKVLEKIEFNW